MSQEQNSGTNNTGTVAEQAIDSGNTKDELTSLLPDEYKTDPSVTKYKNIGELIKGYKSANELIGKSIRLPDPNNKDEVEKFYNKLGRPEKPENYKLNDDVVKKTNTDLLKGFLPIAHQNGMTDKQVEAVVKYNIEVETKKAEALNAETKESEAKLKEIWGNDYQTKLTGVGTVLKAYGSKYGADAMEKLANSAGNNVPFIMMLYDLSVSMKSSKEDQHIHGEGESKFGGLSTEDALSKIKEIRSDLKHPYNDHLSKEHSQAVKEMQELYSRAYPPIKKVAG